MNTSGIGLQEEVSLGCENLSDIELLTTVGQFGLASGIALYLVYWATNVINTQLASHEAVMAQLCDRLTTHDIRAKKIGDDVIDIKTCLFNEKNLK